MADINLPFLPFIPGYVPGPRSGPNPDMDDLQRLAALRERVTEVTAAIPLLASQWSTLDIPGEGGGRTFGEASSEFQRLLVKRIGQRPNFIQLERQVSEFERLIRDRKSVV